MEYKNIRMAIIMQILVHIFRNNYHYDNDDYNYRMEEQMRYFMVFIIIIDIAIVTDYCRYRYDRWNDRRIKEKFTPITPADTELIKMATQLLIYKHVRASNLGGGFENVELLSCEGIDTTENGKYVKFKTDDSWITHVYYSEEQILEMWRNR